MRRDFFELKPSTYANVASELKQIIDATSSQLTPLEFPQEDWLTFLSTETFTSTIYDSLCIVARSKIPWEWIQDLDTFKITLYIHYVQPDRILITEKYIRSPKLCGTFWMPITDIKISFHEHIRTTIIEFFPQNKSNAKFPVLIKSGIDKNEIPSEPNNVYFLSYENPIIPEIDLLSMFYLSLLSMPKSKRFFYIWASMAASLGEQNSQSYLARVCLGDLRMNEAVHWFARCVLEHNYNPAALDLSILLIKYKIKPILAENLLIGLLKSQNDDVIVELGSLYLNGCAQISSEISFVDPPQIDDNSKIISEVKSEIQKGLSLLQYEASEKHNEKAQSIIDEYMKQHPYGDYNLSDLAISAGILLSLLGGSFYILSKIWKSRRK